MHARKPGMILKLIRLPLNGSELKPILRWEDAGGHLTAAALQSSQEHAGQSERTTAFGHDPILDPFHTKLLRIRPT